MRRTYKGIYIKSGNRAEPPPVSYTAEITNILYDNITMDEPEQVPIWIGPAQEADSSNACSLMWPTDPSAKCPAPLSNVRWTNITLRNVVVSSVLFWCALVTQLLRHRLSLNMLLMFCPRLCAILFRGGRSTSPRRVRGWFLGTGAHPWRVWCSTTSSSRQQTQRSARGRSGTTIARVCAAWRREGLCQCRLALCKTT